jgi:hypothetical protein
MNIQVNVENAIHSLIREFLEEPYRFFTEADAVTRFRQILEADPTINQKVETENGFVTSVIHQEYPTFFRFDGKNPIARLPDNSKASRGHYDIVILNPSFVRAHTVEAVKNRDFRSVRNKSILPFEAIIEFKLDDRGWSPGKRKGAIADLAKLVLSREEVELRYFVVLMRYTASTQNKWNKHWPDVLQAATERMEAKSIFATHWVSTNHTAQVECVGDWLSKYEEKHN